MEDTNYVKNKIREHNEISLSRHARKRAEIRGIEPKRVQKVIREGDIIGVKRNDNPNTDIEYSETYLVLISSEKDEFFYLPIYFRSSEVLITTVLKFSDSNTGLSEW
ncbi:MAG: hypothetical protein BRC26_03890 [Nanohaloarchaea archaeon QH_8_44_6]|nr:MAG: hypothetical protein BRC26_03890 [Nanohaloarchaea archaeon QH_8_44_6]